MSGNHKAGGSSSRSGDSVLQPSKPGPTPRGACRRCKKMKMKCEYVDESGPCNRCRSTSNACSVDPRKAITHKSARSELLRQSQRKDELIAALVQHINRSTSAAETRAGTSGSASTAGTPPEADLPEAFMGSSPHVPFPTAAASVTPAETSHLDIVRSGAVRVQEIDELFRFFFVQMNVQLPLLDPNTHYPRAVLDRCPFLFTTILAVAARQLARPGAYTQALACARKAAAGALISESKTVDMCQAYILLGEFLPPAPRWEEDRSSLFRGLAIRLALDLDLGGPNRDRNCTRTWLVCMLLDMHASVGRPPSMPRDGLSRRTRAWSSVPSPVPSDVFLGGAVELFVAASRFQELVAGTSWNHEADVNIGGTLRVSEDALAAVVDEWTAKFSGSSPAKHWLRFLQQYCKLHMLASILERCGDNVEGLYLRTWHAALAALTELTEKVGPTGLISLSPDVLLRPIVFCSSLIMQLLSPRWRQVVSPESRQVALALVERVIAALDPQPHPNVSNVAVVTAGQAHANTLRMTKEALGATGVLR